MQTPSNNSLIPPLKNAIDQNTVISSISSHLDSLNSVTKWLLILSFSVYISLCLSDLNFNILGIKLSKNNLPIIFGIITISFGLYFSFMFLRISNLIRLLTKDNINSGVSKLFLHPWFFNPFVYLGKTNSCKCISFFRHNGITLLWFLLSAPIVVTDTKILSNHFIVVFFIVFTSFNYFSLTHVFDTINSSIYNSNINVGINFRMTTQYKIKFMVTNIILGIIIWATPVIINILKPGTDKGETSIVCIHHNDLTQMSGTFFRT